MVLNIAVIHYILENEVVNNAVSLTSYTLDTMEYILGQK